MYQSIRSVSPPARAGWISFIPHPYALTDSGLSKHPARWLVQPSGGCDAPLALLPTIYAHDLKKDHMKRLATIDHLRPLSKPGDDDLEHLGTYCCGCKAGKGDRP